MSTEELLDHLLLPRPNGSDGLLEVASFIEATLRGYAPEVEIHTFTATPYGFQLLFATVLLLMLGFATTISLGRYGLALLLAGGASALLVVETELLWSPVSGLLALPESNIVGVFPGRVQGPTLVFSAHYDTATQFGDHRTWARWGVALGAAIFIALTLPLAGLWQRRRRRDLSRAIRLSGATVVLVPAGAMAWFFAVGPLVAPPSPGALDNGGSVAVLLRLAERMAGRPINAPTTIKIVFLAAEEERALGSWHYASTLASDAPVAVINLDTVGASERVAYSPEEGFALRRYPPPDALIGLVENTVRELWGEPLQVISYPLGSMTDARSFLAQGIPAVTLLSGPEGRLPRHLHSARDSRDRLSVPALERMVELLDAIVARVDSIPEPQLPFLPSGCGRASG